MKSNAVTRIILFSLVILVLGGVLIGTIFSDQFEKTDIFRNNGFTEISGGNVSSSGTIPAAQVTKLKIQWVAGSITIQPGDTDEITFSETANGEKPMVWKCDADELVIQFSENQWKLFGGIGRNRGRKDLVVTVPRQWVANEVKIEAVSADVKIADLSIGELNLDTVSGTTDVRGCTIDDVSLESVSGNIQYAGSLNRLEVDAVSANCAVSLSNLPQEISMEGVSGNMELTLPESCGFTLNMDKIKSNLTTDFAVIKNGKNYTFGDGSCKIEVNGVSGEVAIHKAAS